MNKYTNWNCALKGRNYASRMGSTYTSIHLHIVFSVKDRAPLLINGIRDRVHQYIGGIIKEYNCLPITIGGTEDHIHILTRVATDITTADLLRHIKSSSSRWINQEFKKPDKFAWQTGYSAFSIGKSKLSETVRYIESQAEHHRTKTFKEELLSFLDYNGIAYKDEYLW